MLRTPAYTCYDELTNGAIIYCHGFAWDLSNADIDTKLMLICDLIGMDSGDHGGIEG